MFQEKFDSSDASSLAGRYFVNRVIVMLRRSTWVFYTGRLRGLVIATDYDGSGFDSYTYLPASTVVNFLLCVSAALNSETLHVAASEEGRDHRDDE